MIMKILKINIIKDKGNMNRNDNKFNPYSNIDKKIKSQIILIII